MNNFISVVKISYSTIFATLITGVPKVRFLRAKAEIIPIEPDTGNAGEGSATDVVSMVVSSLINLKTTLFYERNPLYSDFYTEFYSFQCSIHSFRIDPTGKRLLSVARDNTIN